jgi:hypothetical protein
LKEEREEITTADLSFVDVVDEDPKKLSALLSLEETENVFLPTQNFIPSSNHCHFSNVLELRFQIEYQIPFKLSDHCFEISKLICFIVAEHKKRLVGQVRV